MSVAVRVERGPDGYFGTRWAWCAKCGGRLRLRGMRYDDGWTHVLSALDEHDAYPEVVMLLDADCSVCGNPELTVSPSRLQVQCSRCGARAPHHGRAGEDLLRVLSGGPPRAGG